MKRKLLFIANWKLHKTIPEARAFFDIFNGRYQENANSEVVICPPFTLLQWASSASGKCVATGAQDVFWESEGAYTGEISVKMLKDLSCRYVIIGHSERRRYFGETNESVNRKTSASLRGGLIPVVCVGETLREMESGKARSVVETQVTEGLDAISWTKEMQIVLAYEPVWAIGTGKADTPEQSNRTIAHIREAVRRIAGKEASQSVRILYGGSVNPENIRPFMSQPEIDGALVGSASLDPNGFLEIIQSVDSR